MTRKWVLWARSKPPWESRMSWTWLTAVAERHTYRPEIPKNPVLPLIRRSTVSTWMPLNVLWRISDIIAQRFRWVFGCVSFLIVARLVVPVIERKTPATKWGRAKKKNIGKNRYAKMGNSQFGFVCVSFLNIPIEFLLQSFASGFRKSIAAILGMSESIYSIPFFIV